MASKGHFTSHFNKESHQLNTSTSDNSVSCCRRLNPAVHRSVYTAFGSEIHLLPWLCFILLLSSFLSLISNIWTYRFLYIRLIVLRWIWIKPAFFICSRTDAILLTEYLGKVVIVRITYQCGDFCNWQAGSLYKLPCFVQPLFPNKCSNSMRTICLKLLVQLCSRHGKMSAQSCNAQIITQMVRNILIDLLHLIEIVDPE